LNGWILEFDLSTKAQFLKIIFTDRPTKPQGSSFDEKYVELEKTPKTKTVPNTKLAKGSAKPRLFSTLPKDELTKHNVKDNKDNEMVPEEDSSSFQFINANAMPWDGVDRERTGIPLSNTCTIDNMLTAIYVIISSRPDVAQDLSRSDDTAIHVILQICQTEMKNHLWAEAKLRYATE
jgi:hypothetical protein